MKRACAISVIAIKNVDIHQARCGYCQLVAMGGKPITNIVDATNYVIFSTTDSRYGDRSCDRHKLGDANSA